MFLQILLLLVGFVALVIGADKLVEGASALAKKFGIPDIVIGLTIVALGTSAPEVVVNVFSAVSGSTEMALGNVLGSNIFNVLGILGVAALFAPLTVNRNTTWTEIPLSFLASLVLLFVASDVVLDGLTANHVVRSEGWILIGFFMIFIVYNIQVAVANKEQQDLDAPRMKTYLTVLYIVGGLVGLIVGGRLIVDNAVSIAATLGISQRIISLTIVSIGTSLPELATSVMAARRGKTDIAIGNVVGSNILNSFFVLGLTAIISPLHISGDASMDLLVNIVGSALLFVFLFTGKGRKLERWEGILFIAMYVAYLVYLVAHA